MGTANNNITTHFGGSNNTPANKYFKNLTDVNNGNVTLEAIWTANTYKITINPNNGTYNGNASNSTIDATYDKEVNIVAPTRTGYTFTGWKATSIDTATAKYGTASANTAWSNASTTPKGPYFKNLTPTNGATVTLTAQWTANTYTLSYALDGGAEGTSTPKQATYDVAVNIPNPTKTGYTFTGWTATGNFNTSTAKYGTTNNPATAWSSGSTQQKGPWFKNLATSGTVTLTAHWTANTYTISYNLDGGTLASKPGSGTYDALVTINNPTRTGYTFAGWIATSGLNTTTAKYGTTNNPTTTWSNANTPVKSIYFKNLTPSGTVTLKATWTINSYTVTYDAQTNGGTESARTEKVNYNGAIDLTSKTATKTGYTFVGWNTNKGAHDGLSSLKMGTSEVTLYAIFKKDITVTFKDYNGSAASTRTSKTTIYNKETGSVNALSIQTYTNWTAQYWTTGTGATSTNNQVSGGGSITGLTADRTYYAVYHQTVKLTFRDTTGDQTASGTRKVNSYSISSITNPSITAPAIRTYTGWTARYWTTGTTATASGNNVVSSGSIPNVSSAKTYYARYYQAVTVKFSLNGGSGTIPGDQTVNRETNSYNKDTITNPTITLPSTTATKTGYTFEGWFESASGGSKLKSPYTVTASKTLYAHWTANTVTINVNKDGSAYVSSGMKVKLNSNGTEYTVPSSGTVTISAVENGAYTIYASKSTNDKNTLVSTGMTVNVSGNNPSQTIDYYTLTINKRPSVTSTTGQGTYLKGQTANITATAAANNAYGDGLVPVWDVTEGDTPANPNKKSTTVTMNSKTTLMAVAEWEFFYQDPSNNGYIYLILSDYLPTAKLPNDHGLITDGEYIVCSITSRDDLITKLGDVDKNGNTNIKASNTKWKTILPDAWKTKNDTEVIAAGAASLQLWVNSWNKTNTGKETTLYIGGNDTGGYKVGNSSSPSTDRIQLQDAERKETTHFMYDKYKGDTSKAMGYWLASPSAANRSSYVMCVNSCLDGHTSGDGYVDFYYYGGYYIGLRPVVRLKSDLISKQ